MLLSLLLSTAFAGDPGYPTPGEPPERGACGPDQAGPRGPHPGGRGGPPPLAGFIVRAVDDGELDDATVAAVHALADAARPHLTDLHEDVKAAHQALRAEMDADLPDGRALLDATRDLDAAESALREAEMKLAVQMIDRLGADGWAQVRAALPAPGERGPQDGRGPHGGPPGGR